MKFTNFILIIFLFINISCTPEEQKETSSLDYLTFGHFYGFCIGDNCVSTFKITDHKLFKDITKNYSGEDLVFTELNNDKFELAVDLIDAFPLELLKNEEEVIGCPDCSDKGGLFIQHSVNGIVKSWRIDLIKTNVPEYLHDFMDKVQEKIALINS